MNAIDCLIVGGGPAGLTAALDLARYLRSVKVVDALEGRTRMIGSTHNIGPFPDGISGRELLHRMRSHAELYGAATEAGTVSAIVKQGDVFQDTTDRQVEGARNVIFATGVVNHRPTLSMWDHDRGLARGLIRYCPVCHAYEIRGKRVAVLGQGKHGFDEAIFLRQYSGSVTLITPDGSMPVARDGIGVLEAPMTDLGLADSHVPVTLANGEIRHFDTLYVALGTTASTDIASMCGNRSERRSEPWLRFVVKVESAGHFTSHQPKPRNKTTYARVNEAKGDRMAARAIWKGNIKLAELVFPVALYAAGTTSQRISFHVLNRKTGNRVHREYVDEETEKPVEKEQQVKGYETAKDQYIILDPDEIADAVPESDKTLKIEAFIPCNEVEAVYFDKPYFIAPSDKMFSDPFAVVREGMRKKKVAALARTVLFRRVRTVMLRAQGCGLVAHTLNFDYEVRSGAEVFADLPDLKIAGEMLDLAKHIIGTKKGKFHPSEFDDRYDTAVAELVKAKIEGREIKAPKPPKETKVTSLMDALRESAKASAKTKPRAPSKKKTSSSSRKTAEPAKPRKAG